MDTIHRKQLEEMNGRDGKPACIAYNGKIYDVSGSRLWADGTHMRRHHAGEDLTEQLPKAPHGPEVLERVPQIATLEETPGRRDAVPPPEDRRSLLNRFPFLKRHPHPMMVHFPICLFILTPLFYVLSLLSGNASLEQTSLHCLAAGVLFTPMAIASGYATWFINYDRRPVKAVRIKIICSWSLLALAAILLGWRLSMPAPICPTTPCPLYSALIFLLAPVVSIVGWFGGRLTFPPE